MKLHFTKVRVGIMTLALVASLSWIMSASTQPAAPAPDNAALDVDQLFAATCGWCHSDGGRAAGRGPQLMASPKSDDFLRDRIKHGKTGAMPAYDSAFSDAQIDAMVKYIRSLKPREG
jgi:mono/diheme cytochrome c family protein